ncbi:hypothetical protein A2129_01770 [Candidatus Woesebacteria bacterium GWC1_42_13]|uniref:Uncharacterized protein n=2 Tax=Candidatus Woeseibacteriota TaxID=1752722 RepID=A0A1F7WYA2_9BACT|nr:MAG: hypothetical protein A2112_02175 [Candidatus Woesebacteria bacterium GWA1_42_12]OGM07824.1 MAG: hypothetical protein A2129_01770 [Candidatus Woesebacteria bacterium GWC1_42_13]
MPQSQKTSNAKVPYVPLNSPLKIEGAKVRSESVPSYSGSPLTYESALAQAKVRDGKVRRDDNLFVLGSVVTILMLLGVAAIYFFLLKYT